MCDRCERLEQDLADEKDRHIDHLHNDAEIIMRVTYERDAAEKQREEARAEAAKLQAVVDAYLGGDTPKKRAKDLREYLADAAANDPTRQILPPIADALEALPDV